MDDSSIESKSEEPPVKKSMEDILRPIWEEAEKARLSGEDAGCLVNKHRREN